MISRGIIISKAVVCGFLYLPPDNFIDRTIKLFELNWYNDGK